MNINDEYQKAIDGQYDNDLLHVVADGKTIGEVYFWNYTEATIVAIISKETGRAQQSPGPDFPLHVGDKLLFVGKDDLSFDRVLSFLVYGVLEENAEPQE